MPRRCRSLAVASAARSGSPPDARAAGRGRRGRTWVSEPGNLFASLLLTDTAPPEHWPELALVAALAIHDAVTEAAPAVRPQLFIKWPNDLLLAGKKCSGILIEGEGGQGAVVVGIGVNCVSHPADTDYPATDLAAAGAEVTAEALFTVLSAKMLGRLGAVERGRAFLHHPRGLARARRRTRRSDPRTPRRPGAGRAVSTMSTKRGAWCCRCRTADASRSPPATSLSSRGRDKSAVAADGGARR